MNKTKQFWSLFKFQTTINPFIWFMPVAFGAPFLITGNFPSSYHSTLSSLLTVQNLFFAGIFGAFVLAPERFLSSAANTAWSSSGTEFLLTRTIDRPLLYRSKAAFFFILVLLMPLFTLLLSLKNPNLKVIEYSNMARHECLNSVPGSTLEPDPSGSSSPLIVIPQGNILIEEWHFWQFIISVIVVQALILLLYPLKYRLWLFYALFMSFIFVPDLIDLHHIRDELPSHTERLFFSFAANQAAFWIFTAFALILGQLWCERRFARLEQ